MKAKTLLSFAIVASMLFAVFPLIPVKAQETTVQVTFPSMTNEFTTSACQEFIVTLNITNSPPVDFWAMEIRWDAEYLELVPPSSEAVKEGDFFKKFNPSTGFVCVEPESATEPYPNTGVLPDIMNGFLVAAYAEGDGYLCSIKFHAIKPTPEPTEIIIWLPNEGGESYLLYGPDLVLFTPVNGLVTILPPPATPPDAEFTPGDGASFTVPVDVTLDGSMSTPGYDTLPDPGHECPITEWTWEIDIGNDGIIEDTLYGEIVTYHFDNPGVVGITLTVYAPDPNPPSAPDYVDTNSEKHLIMLLTPVIGPDIDVYTDRGGEGKLGPYPFGWSDAYGPQEEVIVCAKVTYNEEPVEYKPVGFEIIDPDGVSQGYRVSYTDANGMACVSFRIPWEGSNAEDLFGDWSIVGTVDVAGENVTDTVMFRFGYILEIRGITVTGSPLHKGETMTIDLDIKSISMSSKNTFLTIVAYDECGVPIGLATATFTVDPEDGIAPGYTITIPSWAFVGTGTIYVNLFTAPPSLGGVPYCPEETTSFTILKTP